MRVICTNPIVEVTLGWLRDAGHTRRECVALWLGRRAPATIDVVDAYRPEQTAAIDMFHIPPRGMSELHAVLRQRRLMVAAQVHSHPAEAFHSKADDRWAIVRHEGALSLVVPHFALQTTPQNFLAHTKVYRFTATSRWEEIPEAELARSWLTIT
jgi:proteasome lid subunit RPN8/RPN11